MSSEIETAVLTREQLANVLRPYLKEGLQPEPFGGSLDTADLAADSICKHFVVIPSSDRFKEAVGFIFTHACVDALNRNREALDKGDIEAYKNDPAFKLTNALQAAYPEIMDVITGRIKEKAND